MNPALTDRALAQTVRAGLTYAVVPLPWFHDWLTWAVARGGAGFDTEEMCWRKDVEGVVDDEGNIHLCLLHEDHDEPCGYMRAIEPATVDESQQG